MSAWNPSDKAAGITLSSTNHVATSSSGNNSVRGTKNHATGLWYIEFKGITVVGSALVGLAELAQSLTTNTMTSALGGDAGSPGHLSGGLVSTENLSSAIAGHTLGIALNLTSDHVWARLDAGAWVGDGVSAGDPVADTHGNALIGRAGAALYPFAFLQNGGTATINTGDSAFDNAAPTGYAAWDAPPILPPLKRALVIF